MEAVRKAVEREWGRMQGIPASEDPRDRLAIRLFAVGSFVFMFSLIFV